MNHAEGQKNAETLALIILEDKIEYLRLLAGIVESGCEVGPVGRCRGGDTTQPRRQPFAPAKAEGRRGNCRA
jgi:hypothetical protein